MRPVVVVAAAAHNDTSTPFNLVSMPGLIRHGYDGRGLRIGARLAAELGSDRYRVTYRSGSLTISGQLSVPRRAGRFPLVVLAHGYEDPRTYRSGSLTISGQLSVPRRAGRFPLVVLAHGYEDPATYRSGAALSREQAYLSARGYVVLLTDYRNYGDSDHDSADPVAAPLGYPEDLVNAVLAVRRAHLPFVDASRVGVLGRSMGGGVALQAVAARPRLFDALVLYSPVSSLASDNFERWVAGKGDLDARVLSTYGSPQDNPRFWQEASVRSYLRRVDVPVQVHHGLADDVCPPAWSRATVEALRRAGQRVGYFEYPGEGHRFGDAWPSMASRVADFLDDNV